MGTLVNGVSLPGRESRREKQGKMMVACDKPDNICSNKIVQVYPTHTLSSPFFIVMSGSLLIFEYLFRLI